MIFYDSNKEFVKVSVTEKISNQFNSHNVYKTDDGRCLKVFRVCGNVPELTLDKKIQSLDLDNFFKIEQYLFDKSGNYRAFLMPFYKSISDDILLRYSDYISDNFSFIFNSFDKLANERIETWDSGYENTIFSDNKIIIIDSERYCERRKDDVQEIKNRNYMDACWILYYTLMKSAMKNSEFCDIPFLTWYNWFNTMESDGRELCSELSGYKYPIEYLRKVKKKIK